MLVSSRYKELSGMQKHSRIFIAGHQGLIGSAFMRHYQAEGYTHILTSSRDALNLLDRAAVFDFFQKNCPEYIIIAAGRVGGILENKMYPADFIQQNLELQLNIFAAALKFNADRIVYFGSSCMYPRDCPQPIKEDFLLNGKPEGTSLAYAMAKLSGVQMCLSYNEQFNCPGWFLPVIPNSVYGYNDNFDPDSGHVLSSLISRFHLAKKKRSAEVILWGSGTPRREFLFSDDLVDACNLLLTKDLSDVTIPINIGPGEDISIKELSQLVANVVGYEGKIVWDKSKPDGVTRKLLDSTKIKKMGWEARTPLKVGIEKTYDWYLHHAD